MKPTLKSDEALAAAAQHGDRAAYAELIRRHSRGLYGLCRRLSRDEAAAEDRVQEALLRGFERLDRFRGGSFRAWIYRIARNLCLDVLRAERDLQALPEVEPVDASPAPLSSAEREDLLAACAELDGRARAILHAKYTEGLSAPEIARALDMTPSNVRVCLHRAIRELRRRLT